MDAHPLVTLLREAVRGRFPPADGTVLVAGPPPGRSDAVVAFSAHSVVAAGVEPDHALARLPDDDPGAPMSVEFLGWLSQRLQTRAGMLDLVLVAPTPDPDEDLPELVLREDLVEHPRLARSRRYRTDLRCYSDRDDRSLIVLGRGLAERWEMGIEVRKEHRGIGLGRVLARTVARLASPEEPLFAQISPGNVASVRAFLAAGYRPICSEVVFLRKE